MKFSDMKVSTRLTVSFGILLACLALTIAAGLNRMAEINARLNSIANVNNVEGRYAWQMRTAILTQSILVRDLMLSPDPAQRRVLLGKLRTEIDAYGKYEKALDTMFRELVEETQPRERTAMDLVLAQANAGSALLGKLLARADADDVEGIKAVLEGGLQTEQAKLSQRLQELVELEDTLNRESGEEALAFYHNALVLMLVLGAVALVAGIALSMAISRGLKRQLGGEPAYAASIANRIAAGDLTSAVDSLDPRHPSLLLAMKSMNDNLLNIVREVRIGSDAISTATNEIAAGNMDLSSRTEQQAGSLEETAAAIEELTSTVRQNAENAVQANELALSAAHVAEQGGAMVQQVVNTMTSIDESSREIVNIISVIDSISFQTNILALNAAVEAARAGEQGRGFAVVAAEVRSLAQRSTAAAKEIKALIDASVANVNAGYRLVQEAGTTMDGVVQSVKQVCHVIADITEASREQASGIQQVNDAVTQMDQATQQNAALVEQATAAAKMLQEQAQRLAGAVGVFSITPEAGDPSMLRLS